MPVKQSENVRSDSVTHIASRSYTNTFIQSFPYYLSIGMTEEQYWDGDPMLAKYFREAEELRKERKNEELWLQGLYVYDAVARLAPILRPFGKKGTKAELYPKEPYPVTRIAQKLAAEKQAKEEQRKAKQYLETYIAKANKFFNQKKGVKMNGDKH